MKNLFNGWPLAIHLKALIILCLIGGAYSTQALAQTNVWISNPTQYQISYKLSFARSAQNFTLPAGRKNVHTSREYPPTFLVDINVGLGGYVEIKRFNLTPGHSYYFQLANNRLHLLKQPVTYPTNAPYIHNAPVSAKVLVYSLGGNQPIYHSSIILYNTADPYINGREWSFWPKGRGVISNVGYIAGGQVMNKKPAGCGAPIKTFNLTTQHNSQRVASIFTNLRNQWNQRPYRALDSNCNHFVNSVMASLGAGRHPVQYQNSWGAQTPVVQVQRAFETNYGIPCEHGGYHSQPHSVPVHGQGRHQPYDPYHNSRRIDPRTEILRRVLGRIFD